MNVRTASLKDIDQLSRLFNDYRVFYRKESDKVQAKEFLSQRLKNQDSVIYVCDDTNGNLLGFVQLYPLFSSTRMKKLWLLNDLFVDHSHRGKGLSLLLIDRAKQLVRETNACAMFLETEKSNKIGNRLYPKTGFVLNKDSNFYEWSI